MPPRNLALLLTPPGSAAIAVLRLTGPGVADFLRLHFSRPALARRCVHGELADGASVIDDPVVVLSTDGSAADINLHGGPWVVRSALELARRVGFEVQDRLTFPLPPQAIDAAGIEAQVMASLPLAATELALRRLLAQPAAWEAFHRTAGTLSPAAFRDAVGRIVADRSLGHLLHPPRVVIVGAPNVGKSTLANQLFAQERSITADVPGTTRDWVGELANLDGLAVLLVDTPGIRSTADPIEAEAIRRSAGEVAAADLVVLVLDATRALEAEQRELADRFPASARVLYVINKCDRPAAWEIANAIHTVATTGQGVEALRAAIRDHFGCGTEDTGMPSVWTAEQRKALRGVGDDRAAAMRVFEGASEVVSQPQA